ncbi:MAG: hypothetical protein RIE56_09185, partial [Amphiplicatus sp.]
AAAVAAIAAFCAAPAAYAQNSMFDTATMVRGFNVNQLSAMATEFGWTTQMIVADNGSSGLVVKTPEGATFFLEPVACSPQCVGLSIFAFFGAASNASPASLNSFNGMQNPVKVLSFNNAIMMQRYVIADHGTPRGNIAVEMNVFLSLASKFAQYLQGGVGTISDKVEMPTDKADAKPTVEAAFSPRAAHKDEVTPLAAALIDRGEATGFQH